MNIVKQFGLTEDDKLDRMIKAEGGELIIHIKPIKTGNSGKDMNTFQKVWIAVKKHKIRLALYLGFLDVTGFIFYPVVWWVFVSIVAPLNFLLVFFASLNLYAVDQRKERQKLENSQNESKTIENT